MAPSPKKLARIETANGKATQPYLRFQRPLCRGLYTSVDLGFHPQTGPQKYSDKDLQRAFECGKWGDDRPSDLFLKVSIEAFCVPRLICCGDLPRCLCHSKLESPWRKQGIVTRERASIRIGSKSFYEANYLHREGRVRQQPSKTPS